MKLALLGTGMIVKDLLTTIEKIPLEKKYLLGTKKTEEETELLAEKYRFDGTYYDYSDLLDHADIDTVYVALPNHLHYAFAKEALEKGKHVIIEKPVTANYRELEELAAIAKKNKLMIFEAMSVVHMPAYLSLKSRIKDLGTIKIVSLNYSQYSSRYDAFKNGEVLPVFDPDKAGGALMDLNVYNISFIVGLFGEPLSVHYESNVEKGIDTSGIVALDYGSFKAVAIAAKDCKAPLSCSVQGDKACIYMNHPVNGMKDYEIDYNDGRKESYKDDSDSHRLVYEFCDIIKAINNQDYEYMYKALKDSMTVSRIMNQARRDAGIVFSNDK